jgi:hypothetical protein
MAKDKVGNGNSGDTGDSGGSSGSGQGGQFAGADRIPVALREFGEKAVELANNPIARSMLAAGLVTAAAALTANQKNRDTVRKAASNAADATEDAAENARRIGAALVTAATESFQRMFSTVSGSGEGDADKKDGAEEAELPLTTPRRGGGASSAGKERGGGGAKASACSGGSGKGARAKSKSGSTGETSGKKGGRKKNSGGSSTQAG